MGRRLSRCHRRPRIGWRPRNLYWRGLELGTERNSWRLNGNEVPRRWVEVSGVLVKEWVYLPN